MQGPTAGDTRLSGAGHAQRRVSARGRRGAARCADHSSLLASASHVPEGHEAAWCSFWRVQQLQPELPRGRRAAGVRRAVQPRASSGRCFRAPPPRSWGPLRPALLTPHYPELKHYPCHTADTRPSSCTPQQAREALKWPRTPTCWGSARTATWTDAGNWISCPSTATAAARRSAW